MAISTQDQLVAAVAAGQSLEFFKTSATASAGFHSAAFRAPGQPTGSAAIPTTVGNTLSRISPGAMPLPAPSATTYLSSFSASCTSAGPVILYDRIAEFGGLSGIVTTTQAVSALALPARATGATNVELWIESYAAGGATAVPTVTAAYTNQSGTAGRTATLQTGFPANGAPQGRTYRMTLQAGDTGVQSVQSLTLSVSSGTAGNLGFVLRRRIQQGTIVAANSGFERSWAETDLAQIPNDACLEFIQLASNTFSGNLYGAIGIAQG